MGRKDFDLSLYLVTDRPLSLGRDIDWIVRQAVEGGCTIVQLREKDCDTREFVALAQELKRVLSPLGIPLIINDRLDVALAVDADGVHIGQSDMPYDIARRLLGPDKIIGLSVESMEDIEEANRLDLDYIGISPIFGTSTKTDTAAPFGLEGANLAMAKTLHPAVGIGGMNHRTAKDVMMTGVDGIAVVSDIVSAPSPKESSETLLKIVRENQGSWSENAWRVVQPLFKKICEHPFQSQMAEGTLSEDVFKIYLQQDSIYLSNYSKEMLMFADMVDDKDLKERFKIFAEDSMVAEKGLHQQLMSEFGIKGADPLPVTVEYMNHTRQYLDKGDIFLSLASILPCMWIYNEVGHYVQKRAKGGKSNPFHSWIECYSSEMMDNGAPVMRELIDRLAEKETSKRKALMRSVFIRGCELEYEFWDQAFGKQAINRKKDNHHENIQ